MKTDGSANRSHEVRITAAAALPGTMDAVAPPARPRGIITRGTTGINRLRRSDRWLVHHPGVQRALAGADDPLVIDLGYGAMPDTTLELATRLRTLRSDIRVIGLEIDPSRVVPARDGVRFGLGGFELAGHTPVVVRAFNVLRQYPESEVAAAWASMQAGLAPDGLIIEGTCDELGRRCAWLLLDASGPLTLTLACDPFGIDKPSDLAERLPKALIHHNVPEQPIHDLLAAADKHWAAAAPHGVFGPRVRWRMMLKFLRDNGFPIEQQRRQVRDCILTTPWSAVAPVA